jgi:hypothetical protein
MKTSNKKTGNEYAVYGCRLREHSGCGTIFLQGYRQTSHDRNAHDNARYPQHGFLHLTEAHEPVPVEVPQSQLPSGPRNHDALHELN